MQEHDAITTISTDSTLAVPLSPLQHLQSLVDVTYNLALSELVHPSTSLDFPLLRLVFIPNICGTAPEDIAHLVAEEGLSAEILYPHCLEEVLFRLPECHFLLIPFTVTGMSPPTSSVNSAMDALSPISHTLSTHAVSISCVWQWTVGLDKHGPLYKGMASALYEALSDAMNTKAYTLGPAPEAHIPTQGDTDAVLRRWREAGGGGCESALERGTCTTWSTKPHTTADKHKVHKVQDIRDLLLSKHPYLPAPSASYVAVFVETDTEAQAVDSVLGYAPLWAVQAGFHVVGSETQAETTGVVVSMEYLGRLSPEGVVRKAAALRQFLRGRPFDGVLCMHLSPESAQAIPTPIIDALSDRLHFKRLKHTHVVVVSQAQDTDALQHMADTLLDRFSAWESLSIGHTVDIVTQAIEGIGADATGDGPFRMLNHGGDNGWARIDTGTSPMHLPGGSVYVLYMPDLVPAALKRVTSLFTRMDLSVCVLDTISSPSAVRKRVCSGTKADVVLVTWGDADARQGTKRHKVHRALWESLGRAGRPVHALFSVDRKHYLRNRALSHVMEAVIQLANHVYLPKLSPPVREFICVTGDGVFTNGVEAVMCANYGEEGVTGPDTFNR
ncbi:hypothetical protein KIPB_000176 [Kipferlia bialata]|uniref:Uncharacterized protein n=1 Tax=Kipferlia bialata TaxID=797122 RepID=A0A9K3CNT1_9EUKA|nr:hypothetical protein KIPB_000176 [Kipferlia bialata]|eukprot:g176.t1